MNLTAFFSNWHNLIFLTFCSVILIQVFYYLFFFLRLAIYKSASKPISQTHPVSVVICARDEAANLATYLPGVLVQTYPTSHEVIVVNDNSFDDSKYLLEELRKNFKQLHIIELTQEAKMIPGKKFPLAIGIKSAKHEIVLLTDADCIPATEHWIDQMQSTYDENTEIVLGYSPFQKKKGFLNKLIRWESFLTALQYLSYALAGKPYMGVGRNLSYKKSLFLKQKGFASHHNVPGGDDDLFINQAANKNNTKINIHPDSFVHTKPAETWKQWMRQKKRHYTTSKFYKPTHKFLLALFALSHFISFPLLIFTCIVYNWELALLIFSAKTLLQWIIYGKAMSKLNEKDLIPYILFFDCWMFFYYILFTPALFKKPSQSWK